MKATKRITLATGLTSALLAAAGTTTFAAGDAGDAGGNAAPPSIPADWVTVVDDTGRITVSVPPTWTDIDTSTFTETTGEVLPSIMAATDIRTFAETFDALGVWYTADTYSADTEAIADEWGLSAGCRDETSEPYDDGVFTGTHVTYTGCGTGSAEFHVIAANPESQAFTAALQIQITGPDELSVLDGIIASFNVASGGSTPTPTTSPADTTAVPTVPTIPVPTVPTVPTIPVPTAPTDSTPTVPTVPGPTVPTVPTVPDAPTSTFTLPSVPELPSLYGIPADWVTITDDSKSIQIAAPPTWTAVNTSASQDGHPWISATPDEAVFFAAGDEQYTVPGVIFMASPFDADTEAVNAEFAGAAAAACTDGGSAPYDDGVFVGHIHTWTACGGTGTTVYQIAANPDGGEFTATLLIQLTGEPDDEETFSALRLSFMFAGVTAGGAVSPVPDSAVPVSTVAGAPATVELGDYDPVTSFLEAMQSSGLTLSYEQAQCWLESMADVDSGDMAAVQAAGEACGVEF